MKKKASQLKKGDIVTSGEEVVSISSGAKTPSGKIEVTLKNKKGKTRTSLWGKSTMIGVKEVNENKKMKKSELKEMVRQSILKEMEGGDDVVDINALLAQLDESSEIEEAKKDEEEADDEEISVDDIEDIEDEGGEGEVEDEAGLDMDMGEEEPAEISGDAKEVQDALQTALDGARSLGDKKLAAQIGNIYTFFTRQHIVKRGEDLSEEENDIFEHFEKLAGLK